jgi:hypothetical protein
LLDQAECVRRMSGSVHHVAVALEHQGDDVADGVLVFDDEDRLDATR